MTLDLDALEALCREATDGPWGCNHDRTLGFRSAHVRNIGREANDYVATTVGPKAHTNGDFIAACREAVPALIAEVRRLREKIERHNGANMELHCDGIKEDWIRPSMLTRRP